MVPCELIWGTRALYETVGWEAEELRDALSSSFHHRGEARVFPISDPTWHIYIDEIFDWIETQGEETTCIHDFLDD